MEEVECSFIGGPFDGQTKKGKTALASFFNGMTLTFRVDGKGHVYVWKEGMTFEYQGVRDWERAEPQQNKS